jgi:hypothetical protein
MVLLFYRINTIDLRQKRDSKHRMVPPTHLHLPRRPPTPGMLPRYGTAVLTAKVAASIPKYVGAA